MISFLQTHVQITLIAHESACLGKGGELAKHGTDDGVMVGEGVRGWNRVHDSSRGEAMDHTNGHKWVSQVDIKWSSGGHPHHNTSHRDRPTRTTLCCSTIITANHSVWVHILSKPFLPITHGRATFSGVFYRVPIPAHKSRLLKVLYAHWGGTRSTLVV